MVKNPPAKALDKRDAGSIPRWERSPGGGHGNPLQFSCLENTMDRGAWWATVHWVAQSQTQLKWLSSSSSINTIITFSVWKVLLFDPFVSYSYNPSSFCSISNYLLLEKVVYTHVQFINTHRLFKPLWFLPQFLPSPLFWPSSYQHYQRLSCCQNQRKCLNFYELTTLPH